MLCHHATPGSPLKPIVLLVDLQHVDPVWSKLQSVYYHASSTLCISSAVCYHMTLMLPDDLDAPM